MSNRVVYACDVSDEGSDMDVSDNEEYVQPQPPPQQVNTFQNKLPHQGMVTSLHRYMQRDSWGENAIKPRVENILKPVPAPTNESSYASAVLGKKRSFNPDESDEECLSDDSFHTAPSSPQAIVIDDFEPGQIADPPTHDELLNKMKELEKKLQSHVELEERIKDNLKNIRARKEELRIRRLQREVRLSIAKNRKPAKGTKKILVDNVKGVTDYVPEAAGEKKPSSVKETAPPPPLSKHAKKVLREEAAKKRKSKKRSRSPLLEDPEMVSTDNSNCSIEIQDQEEMGEQVENDNEDDYDEDEDEDYVDEEEIEDQKEEDEEADEEMTDDPSGALPNNNGSVQMNRRYTELAREENQLSPEEKELTKPDGPFYKTAHTRQKYDGMKRDREAITKYLTVHPVSLKRIMLILMNFKQTSRNYQLSPRQEHFIVTLARTAITYYEHYMSLEEPYYTQAINDKPLVYEESPPLPPDFYGNWHTLNFNAPDVSNYELFKCLRHFEVLFSKIIMRKAIRYILKSGPNPKPSQLPKIRHLDLTENTPEAMAIKNDPTLCPRIVAISREVKKAKKKKERGASQAGNTANLNKNLRQDSRLKPVRKMKKSQVIKSLREKQTKRQIKQAKNLAKAQAKAESIMRSRAQEDTTPIFRANAQVKSEPVAQVKAEPVFPFKDKKKAEPILPANHTPMTHEEIQKMDHETERLEKEIDYMAKHIAAQIHSSKKQKTAHNTSTFRNYDQGLQFNPPFSANQHSSTANGSNFGKPHTVNAPQPPSARPLLNNNRPTHHNAGREIPIEILNDDEKPKPPASHKVPNPVQHNIPLTATRSSPLTTGASNSSQYIPYRSALSSLGLAATSSAPAAQQPVMNKSSTLCSAESSGGACNDNNCRFTHFKDFF